MPIILLQDTAEMKNNLTHPICHVKYISDSFTRCWPRSQEVNDVIALRFMPARRPSLLRIVVDVVLDYCPDQLQFDGRSASSPSVASPEACLLLHR